MSGAVITTNVRNVFRDGELDANSVCAKFAHTSGAEMAGSFTESVLEEAAEVQRPLVEGNMQTMYIASAAKPSLMRPYQEALA